MAKPTQHEEMPSALTDLKDERVPAALYWSCDQVSDWITKQGFQCYKPCIQQNKIDGRRLISLDASHLPKIGITDFAHIKIIVKGIRDLLNMEEPSWNPSITLPPRDDLGMYLEAKMSTGKSCDSMTFKGYLINHKDAKWRPQLGNMCLILPHDA